MAKGSGSTRIQGSNRTSSDFGSELRRFYSSPSEITNGLEKAIKRMDGASYATSNKGYQNLSSGIGVKFSISNEDGERYFNIDMKLPTGKVKNIASEQIGTRRAKTLEQAAEAAKRTIGNNIFSLLEKYFN